MTNKNQKNNLKLFTWSLIFILLIISFYLIIKRYRQIEYEKTHTYREYVQPEVRNDHVSNTGALNTKIKSEEPLPEKIMIDVPFTTQAPSAIWDEVHEEACEEASLIMVQHFINKSALGSKVEADQKLLDLVKYEEAQGYKVDITIEELNQIAKGLFNLKTGRIVTEFSITDIKKELASGRPIIIPAAGKLLQNPNFRAGGPNYHMLVIKGYDEKGFITNDPGTRNGNGYRYDFDLLYNAIHNWDKANILNGPRSYLVFD